MHKLLNWYNPPYAPAGIPEKTNCDYMEVFTPRRVAPLMPWDFYHPSMPFPPEKEELKLPAHLFMVVKKSKSILFDFFSFSPVMKVVSERLLHFIQTQGLTSGYEIAKATIVNTKGTVLTQNPYYFLRVGRFQDDQLYFVESSKKVISSMNDEILYKEIQTTKEAEQQVFFSSKPFYDDALLVDERLADVIKKEFYMPDLYSAEEYTREWLETMNYLSIQKND